MNRINGSIIGQLAEMRSSNDKLIQIARSIVVYGAPDKVPEITRRFFNSHCTSANSVELTACLEREVGKKSLSNIARRAILRKKERCCLSFMLSGPLSPINIWCFSVSSKSYLLVKNRLRHFRC